jgi:hypothetical protein
VAGWAGCLSPFFVETLPGLGLTLASEQGNKKTQNKKASNSQARLAPHEASSPSE